MQQLTKPPSSLGEASPSASLFCLTHYRIMVSSTDRNSQDSTSEHKFRGARDMGRDSRGMMYRSDLVQLATATPYGEVAAPRTTETLKGHSGERERFAARSALHKQNLGLCSPKQTV